MEPSCSEQERNRKARSKNRLRKGEYADHGFIAGCGLLKEDNDQLSVGKGALP